MLSPEEKNPSAISGERNCWLNSCPFLSTISATGYIGKASIHYRDKNIPVFFLLKDSHWEEVEVEHLKNENLKGRKNK